MNLPKRIFFTGVPGSRWSGIAEVLESIPGFNTSDRIPSRVFLNRGSAWHKGAYFGDGMEFSACLDADYIDQAWVESGGTRLIKSHDWAYNLNLISPKFPDDWIMLVYRPDLISYAWWHEAGGFKIEYPNYQAYRDSHGMMAEIIKQNAAILEYGASIDAKWSYFTPNWIEETFGNRVSISRIQTDILVTVIKPDIFLK
jgi:hypothetical protein